MAERLGSLPCLSLSNGALVILFNDMSANISSDTATASGVLADASPRSDSVLMSNVATGLRPSSPDLNISASSCSTEFSGFLPDDVDAAAASLDNICSQIYSDIKSCGFLKIANFNARSLRTRSKVDEIYCVASSMELDVVSIVETWLRPKDKTNFIFKPFLDTYNIYRKDRKDGTSGGGVCILVRKELDSSRKIGVGPPGAEILGVEVSSSKWRAPLLVVSAYRAPSNPGFFDDISNTLAAAFNRFKNVVLLGDINADILQPNSSSAKRILSIYNEFAMKCVINEPTRLTTLLDHIVVNSDLKILDSFVGQLLPADHAYVGAILDLAKSRSKRVPKWVRDFRNFDPDAYSDDVKSALAVAGQSPDLESDCCTLARILSDLADIHAPRKRILVREHGLPWISSNARITRLMELRRKAYISARSSNWDPQAWGFYKRCRNRVVSELRSAKSEYFGRLLAKATNSSRFWRILNWQVGDKVKNDCVGPIRDPLTGQFTRDDKQKAECFNAHFVSAGSKATSGLPPVPSVDEPDGHVSDGPFLSEVVATPDFVLRFFGRLELSKSAGPDGITPKLLKAAARGLSEYVADLINRSLSIGIFPDEWKGSRVIPLYKKGESVDPDNYRPISLTNIISKCAESVVDAAVQTFDSINHVTCPEQHAFRVGHSTDTALICISDLCRGHLNNGHVVTLCAVDFKKAFDSLKHKLLLKSVYNSGIRGNLYNWIESYLSKRTQVTVVNGCPSEPLPVVTGVPQGSVLGPRLFSLFMNSLPKALAATGVECVIFADDLTIVAHGRSLEECKAQLQSALRLLSLWSSRWQLAVHPEKCELMPVGSSASAEQIAGLNISYNDTPVPCVSTMKLLGVVLDCKLSYRDHVLSTISKAEQFVSMLRRLAHLPKEARRSLWLQKFLPAITYGIAIWRDCPKLLMDRLEALHRHAAKLVLGRKFRDDGHVALTDLGWETIDVMYKRSLLRFGYLASAKLLPAPLQALFIGSSRDSGLSGGRTLRFVIPRSKPTRICRNKVSIRVAQIWNHCPQAFKAAISLNCFKSQLRRRCENFTRIKEFLFP